MPSLRLLVLLLPLLADLCIGFGFMRVPRDTSVRMLAKKSRRRTVTDEIEALQRLETGDDVEASDLPGSSAGADSGIDDNTRAKLKAEIASPFRRLRQFFYIAAGVAGGLGMAKQSHFAMMKADRSS